ncbi:MAG TPA: ferritin-like protein [Allosphingosinicella sp.]|nr:ferritin-like protein [Allosphingosinicella sp.]
MIRLQAQPLNSVEDARTGLQTAIELEFSTLPPYLYAKFSILPDSNPEACDYLGAIVGQEMIHLCLACNILNALGGTPALNSQSGSYPWPPLYPTTLPGDIGPPGGEPICVELLPFSEAATAQGMAIELPENPLVFPELLAVQADDDTETIGQFYERLDAFLATLPASDWQADRNQISDDQFFPGQLYPVNDYADAHRAISQIVSEGEGSSESPLDFQNEVSHYYRFKEMNLNKVLTKTPQPPGYQYGPEPFGIDWSAVFPAIPNPSKHDFSNEPPAAQAAQAACNVAYSRMIDALQLAVTGAEGALGIAVRAMFDLRMASLAALRVPLADGRSVAGPSFIYIPNSGGASS